MKRVAVVTGASKGIGEAIAKELASRGWDLILIARSADLLDDLKIRLVETYGIDAEVYACDLCNRAERNHTMQAILDSNRPITALINNAGFGSTGAFVDLDISREIQQIELNVSALVALTHGFLPHLLAQSQGYVLNIASTAAFQPGPYMAVYYATKAFVLHFSEALATELRGTTVSVTAHCPGATESEFAKEAGNDKTLLFSKMNHVMSREVVAKHAVDSMLQRKSMAIAGWRNWLLAFTIRFSPRKVVARLAGWINQPGRWS